MARRCTALLGACAAAVLALVLGAALVVGTEPISLARALGDASSLDRTLVVEIRLPRVLLATVCGAGLAVVGTAFQALLRNPLAEPYLLGVSGGAAAGATLALVTGLAAAPLIGAAVVPFAAFVGGLAATWVVYAVARGAPVGSGGTSILLAGVMVNAIASALITFAKTLVSPSRAQSLLRWLTGFVELPTTESLAVVAAAVFLGAATLLWDAGRLNLLALGSEGAATLGVDVARLERRVFFASSCIVGAIVSLTGLIGFVGLLVPHALRRLVGPDQRTLLPLSLVGGAIVVVVCDLASRVAFRWLGTEPPVGAITALVGGPLFLALLRRRR